MFIMLLINDLQLMENYYQVCMGSCEYQYACLLIILHWETEGTGCKLQTKTTDSLLSSCSMKGLKTYLFAKAYRIF